MEGRSFGDILRCDGESPPTIDKTVKYAQQLSSALEYLHKVIGVVHGSISKDSVRIVIDDKGAKQIKLVYGHELVEPLAATDQTGESTSEYSSIGLLSPRSVHAGSSHRSRSYHHPTTPVRAAWAGVAVARPCVSMNNCLSGERNKATMGGCVNWNTHRSRVGCATVFPWGDAGSNQGNMVDQILSDHRAQRAYDQQVLVFERSSKPLPSLAEHALADGSSPEAAAVEAEESQIRLRAARRRLSHGRYTAPEVVRGFHSSTASDVYSLGCVLLHLFTGAPPLPHVAAGHDAAVLVAEAGFRPPLHRLPCRELLLLVESCLSHNPAHRPDIAEVCAALKDGGPLWKALPGRTRAQRLQAKIATAVGAKRKQLLHPRR